MEIALSLLATFGLCIASGLIPLINGELVLIGFILKAPVQSVAMTGGLVLAAGMGQMIAKIVMYYVGKGAFKLSKKKEGKFTKAIKKYQHKMEENASAPSMLLFVSAFIGLPPFYVISILAGTFNIPFMRFFLLGSVGRIMHFAVVAFFPEIWKHYSGA